MEDEEACNTRLCLGLGIGGGGGGGGYVPRKEKQKENKPVVCLDLSFEFCPPRKEAALDLSFKAEDDNNSNNINQLGLKRVNGRSVNHINNKNGGCRKKLRLSKDQSALLEDSFKLHATLNPAQKQALSEQLNLKPRQVEVWFQNRRARTKLKQTEVDCEFLKKWCEGLSEENHRLKRELQELRGLKTSGPSSSLFLQLPKAATLTLCTSCEKLLKPTIINEEGKANANGAILDGVVRNNNKTQAA